jgi:hypothetical protein
VHNYVGAVNPSVMDASSVTWKDVVCSKDGTVPWRTYGELSVSCLFYDAVITSDHRVLNCRTTGEQESIWKEAVMV